MGIVLCAEPLGGDFKRGRGSVPGFYYYYLILLLVTRILADEVNTLRMAEQQDRSLCSTTSEHWETSQGSPHAKLESRTFVPKQKYFTLFCHCYFGTLYTLPNLFYS